MTLWNGIELPESYYKMDKNRIKKLYTESNWTLRMVADEFGTNHHKIKRILMSMGVPIVRVGKPRKPFSYEHRINISKSRIQLKANGYIPYNKGLKTEIRTCKNGKTGKELLYLNMASHLRHTIEVEWLMKFTDIEKLKFLNRSISRQRDFGNYSKNFYTEFIVKFYDDKQFNSVYEIWCKDKSNNLLKPSPDHINPKIHGLADIDNIRFITWFENRCKNNMSLDQWEKVKENISSYFIKAKVEKMELGK